MRTVDVCGEVKPRSRAWVNGKTIWFVLYRRSKYPIGGHKEGTWIPVTRTHPKTARAARMVKNIMAEYSENRQERAYQRELVTALVTA